MKLRHVVLAAALAASAPAAATPAADVTVPIHQFIDGFNTGDTKSAYAAYAPGTVAITDEFAPHIWIGPRAPQSWAAEYDRHAKKTGVSGGSVSYGKPTRSEIDGDVAYVIIPTVYTYQQTGKPTAEEGQMTFALRDGKGGWKIAAWTWSGVVPHPAK
jgi:ketosteroid isomerase-like protein